MLKKASKLNRLQIVLKRAWPGLREKRQMMFRITQQSSSIESSLNWLADAMMRACWLFWSIVARFLEELSWIYFNNSLWGGKWSINVLVKLGEIDVAIRDAIKVRYWLTRKRDKNASGLNSRLTCCRRSETISQHGTIKKENLWLCG